MLLLPSVRSPQIESMSIAFESVSGRALFDAVLLNTVQALLMSRDLDILGVVESLFQLELDDEDPALHLVGGKLAFCVTNLLKCLSRDARAGRPPPDPAVASFDARLAALVADVLVCRWESLAKYVVEPASGAALLADQEAVSADAPSGPGTAADDVPPCADLALTRQLLTRCRCRPSRSGSSSG